MNHPPVQDRPPTWLVFLIFLRLGLTSFGGPVAHLGVFRDEFVTQRRWLTERNYADLVALCQFLPGPASSQVGMALGLSRAGYGGALAAWAGFTLPSAIALILFALGMARYGDAVSVGALHGLKVVAVAVVAQAVWGMARNLCTDVLRVSIMAVAACTVLLVPSVWGQVGTLFAAGRACPLFTFAAFLGASMSSAPSGWTGGMLALLAIFAPPCAYASRVIGHQCGGGGFVAGRKGHDNRISSSFYGWPNRVRSGWAGIKLGFCLLFHNKLRLTSIERWVVSGVICATSAARCPPPASWPRRRQTPPSTKCRCPSA